MHPKIVGHDMHQAVDVFQDRAHHASAQAIASAVRHESLASELHGAARVRAHPDIPVDVFSERQDLVGRQPVIRGVRTKPIAIEGIDKP